MKEHYTLAGGYYCATGKGEKIKYVVAVETKHTVRIELITDFAEDYLKHCALCTQTQFRGAFAKVMRKIEKAL